MQLLFKCLLGPASTAFVFTALAAAQTQPTPATPAPAQASKPAVTLHASTQLVVVDVVVTDKNRKPVHGLKQTDFALTEDNAPQTLNHFEEHSAPTAAEATKFQEVPKLPPGFFTNYMPEAVNGAVNILLLDTLNTPLEIRCSSASSFSRISIRRRLEPGLRSSALPPGCLSCRVSRPILRC